MPVSRIESICVVADLYDLKTPNGNEKVIVAVPFDVIACLKIFFSIFGNFSFDTLVLNFAHTYRVRPCSSMIDCFSII